MKLLLLTEDKIDDHFFDYSEIAHDMWSDKFKEASDEFNVSFDRENDEDTSQRSITIPQDTWEHSKCRFRCEMRYAGGDWEESSIYFRCQLVEGHADGVSRYSDPFFIVIPNGDQGNVHLTKNNEDRWHAPGHDESGKEPSETECWRFLNDYLAEMVHREEKNVSN